MKLITFSLWGQDPKYLIGAIRNAELAAEIYPDWICRFYLGASVPSPFIHELEKFKNVQVVQKPDWGDWRGMFWRFEAASEDDVEVMISRDTDSRLNYREKAAVDEWIKSDKGFHIMRDHPWHKFPILGGMWGVKKGVLPNMKELISNFSQENSYGTDYKFFAQVILPSIHDNVIIHDEFHGGRAFPLERKGNEFVGKVWDQLENTIPEHEEALELFLKDYKKEIYIHHHLGLGDHLDCNGMVRTYLNEYKYNKVHVFAKSKYADLIRFMYRDEPKINVVEIPGTSEYIEVEEYLKTHNVKNFIPVGHKRYPWGKEEQLGMGCAEIFYKLANMDYDIRFDKFYFEREPSEEERVLKKLNPSGEKYIFVHDDPSRGFEISDEKIKELAGDCKVIKNDMSENIFHFCKLFENAHQIHCMESSFRSLVEILDIKGELFFHNFRKGASGYLGNSTKQSWKEIKW